MGESTRTVPLHKGNKILDGTYVNVMPVLHALTGCDTTSKIGTKMADLKRLEHCEEQISFEKEPINESMMVAAEK